MLRQTVISVVALFVSGTAMAECVISEWGGVSASCRVIDNEEKSVTLSCRGEEYKLEALDGSTLCDIFEIVLDATLTGTGDITVLVAAQAGGSGAANVKKIDIASGGETGVISGLDITGDLLETSAATVTRITGDVTVGNDLLNNITINQDLTAVIDIAGSLTDEIVIEGRMDATASTPGVVIGGSLSTGGKIQVQAAATDSNDPELLAFSINGNPYNFTAKALTSFESTTDPLTRSFTGGGAANTGFKFDITIEPGPKATIVLDNSDPPDATYDLRLSAPTTAPIDLASITQDTTPGSDPKIHNITVIGDLLDDGDTNTSTVNLPDANLGAVIFDGEFNDTVNVAQIELVSFNTLGGTLCVPYPDELDEPDECDDRGNGGTTRIFVGSPTLAKADQMIFRNPAKHVYFNSGTDTNTNANTYGFDARVGTAGGQYMHFYHIQDGDWPCLGGVTGDLESDGRVRFYLDFVYFERCFEKVTAACASSDLNWDGAVNLADFSTLAGVFGDTNVAGGYAYPDPCSLYPLSTSSGTVADVDNSPAFTLSESGADFDADGVQDSGYIVRLISGTGANLGDHVITDVDDIDPSLLTLAADPGSASAVTYEVRELDVAAVEDFVDTDLRDEMDGDPQWVADVDAVLAALEEYTGSAQDGLADALEDINFAPTANDFSLLVEDDQPPWPINQAIGFGGHFSDPDGDTLVISFVAMPSHGNITYAVDEVTGSVTGAVYWPDNGYTGPDSFTWKVKEYGTTELYVCDPVATVSLTVVD